VSGVLEDIDPTVYDGHGLLMGRLSQQGLALQIHDVPLEAMLRTVARWRLTGQWSPRGSTNPLIVTSETADAHEQVIRAGIQLRDAAVALDTLAQRNAQAPTNV
jgi:hypothetical protein